MSKHSIRDASGMNGPRERKAAVLVVDDDAASRRLLSITLGGAGFEVRTSDNGVHALESVAREPPDIVILDFEMPDLDGAKVCAAIRSAERTDIRELPILMLTAHTSDEDEIACLEAGANDFVSKPVTIAVLKARIDTQIRLRSMSDALRRQNAELAQWRAAQVADLDAARVTQSAILPQSTPQPPGWRVEHLYSPVIQVGGDLYGWRRRADGVWMFWIVDATGHGVAAALFTALTALLFQHATADTSSPGAVLASVNRDFHEVFRGRSYMTACCVAIDASGRLAYAGAGHPPLLVRRSHGEVHRFRAQSPVLGLCDRTDLSEDVLDLQPGDEALLYTDGLYSGISAEGEHLDPEALCAALEQAESDTSSLDWLVGRMKAVASQAAFTDDVAAISLRRQ